MVTMGCDTFSGVIFCEKVSQFHEAHEAQYIHFLKVMMILVFFSKPPAQNC